MPPVGFEPTISTGERPQTYDLHRAANGAGQKYLEVLNLSMKWKLILLQFSHLKVSYGTHLTRTLKKTLQNCVSKDASRQNCAPNLNVIIISSKGQKLLISYLCKFLPLSVTSPLLRRTILVNTCK